jgi:serine/threonine protein kinase
MSTLPTGYTINTTGFKTVKVLQKLGEGGQGAVYRVDYSGEPKALKWYHPGKMKNPQCFYDNIQRNINAGAPTSAFLWPEDITEPKDGSFGYIMNLRPPEYRDFSDFLLAKERFSSIGAMVAAGLNIITGFRELHKRGYSYQDLNDGNFFINPKTGEVLICDNDNVAPDRENLGIAGKCRYMAPEVVLGQKLPDDQSDKFSLSVILYLLLMGNHPLEGKATNPPCLTEELEKKFYGSNPVFMYDPADDSNRPVRGIHTNAINRWPFFPQYIRDMFIRAFDKDVMSGKKPRIIEKDWQALFARLRCDTVICDCGGETFVDAASPSVCINCKKSIVFPVYLKTAKYNVPLMPGVKLYGCYIDDDRGDIAGEIIRSKNNAAIWGIKNLSGGAWYVDADGSQTSKASGEVVQIKKGIKINFGKQVAEII